MVEMLVNISNFLSPIFYKILYMSIVGTVLGILIIILTKYFDNKLSIKLKYFIMLIPILFLMMPINKIEINTSNELLITSVIERVETKLSKVRDLNYSNTSKIDELNSTINKNSDKSIEKNQTNINGNRVYTILPIIWIIGVVISLIIFVISNICLKYKITKSRRLEDVRIDMILTKCKEKLKITKKIDIKLQNFNDSPCIYGIVRPQILLTEGFCKKDDEIIENVFMHELSHYKRKDMITNYILLIMTSLHWFNPFVYGFFKKIRQEMEIATDEIALSKMNKEEKKQYGFTLINLLQTYETKRIVPKVLCITDDSKNMERRIKMIKSSEKLRKYKLSIMLFVITIILCTIIPFMIKPISNAKELIGIDEDKLYKKVEQYLIKSEEQNYYNKRLEAKYKGDNFETFVNIAKLGIRQNGEETHVYVWALIKNYYGYEKIMSSGSSMPYKFTIKDDEIVNCQIPEDGDRYDKSIQEIFPKDIIKKIEKSEELVNEAELEKQVKEYYKSLNSIKSMNESLENINTEETFNKN